MQQKQHWIGYLFVELRFRALPTLFIYTFMIPPIVDLAAPRHCLIGQGYMRSQYNLLLYSMAWKAVHVYKLIYVLMG